MATGVGSDSATPTASHSRAQRADFRPRTEIDDEHRRSFQQGPVFDNLVLADEINRAAAKVQAALFQAMEEHRVTVACASTRSPRAPDPEADETVQWHTASGVARFLLPRSGGRPMHATAPLPLANDEDPMDSAMHDHTQSLPKADLRLHLAGTPEPGLIFNLAQRDAAA